jgi:hypothetical protein
MITTTQQNGQPVPLSFSQRRLGLNLLLDQLPELGLPRCLLLFSNDAVKISFGSE